MSENMDLKYAAQRIFYKEENDSPQIPMTGIIEKSIMKITNFLDLIS